jgi:hypothetical protein
MRTSTGGSEVALTYKKLIFHSLCQCNPPNATIYLSCQQNHPHPMPTQRTSQTTISIISIFPRSIPPSYTIHTFSISLIPQIRNLQFRANHLTNMSITRSPPTVPVNHFPGNRMKMEKTSFSAVCNGLFSGWIS